MMRLLFTLACLFCSVAFGASQLEALRSGAASARSQVGTTRKQQLEGQAELNKLASRIEDLKAHARGKLFPGGELDSALKRSQELSGSLTELAQALSSKQGELESANLALLTELSKELSRLRADFDRQLDRDARAKLLSAMRSLRAEREQVRAMLPATKLPALDAVKPSEDPEDLLEQADLMKDNEDKVRRQLQSLEKRIAEAKEERDLDRRVRQVGQDDSLFDEQDRKLRVRRVEERAADTFGVSGPASPSQFTAGSPPANKSTLSPQATEDTAFTGSPLPGAGAQSPPPTAFGPNRNQADSNAAPAAGGNTQLPPVKVTKEGSDARPAVGGNRVAGNEEDDDLEDLEIQRAKLKGLAEELKARASALQKKAAALR